MDQTIGERIRIIRKSERVHLTLEKFGEMLGLMKSGMSKIERGETNPTEQTLKMICREFSVNEEWLRDGIGEMFAPAPVTEMDRLAEKYHMTKNERILIEKVLELTPAQRALVIDFIKRTADAMDEDEAEDPIEREIADYRRELELEKEVAERSDRSASLKDIG